MLLFSIPLIVVSFINLLDDKNPLPYFLGFLFGFYLISDDRYRESLKENKIVYLLIGVVCGCIAIMIPEQSEKAVIIISQISSIAIIMGLIGIGDTYWNQNSQILQYLSAACFPIYVIHMLLNTVIGFFIVRLSMPAIVKFWIILILTILGSLFVYECIRHIKQIRMRK